MEILAFEEYLGEQCRNHLFRVFYSLLLLSLKGRRLRLQRLGSFQVSREYHYGRFRNWNRCGQTDACSGLLR